MQFLFCLRLCLAHYNSNHIYFLFFPLQSVFSVLEGTSTIIKRANVQPSFSVKQGCPLSPLLFSIHLSLAEGVQGVITGTPYFTVTHLLFADDLSLTSTDHNELQTIINKLRIYAQKKSLTVHTQKPEVMWFNSRPGSFLPPLFFGGTQLPYTDTFKYSWYGVSRST